MLNPDKQRLGGNLTFSWVTSRKVKIADVGQIKDKLCSAMSRRDGRRRGGSEEGTRLRSA